MTMMLERPVSTVAETTPVLRWHAHQAGVWFAHAHDADQFATLDQAMTALEHEGHERDGHLTFD